MLNKKIILLLSGGIDSTTLLAKLSHEGFSIIALSFDYGQKHLHELELAKQNALLYNVDEHKILSIPPELFSSSALVNKEKKLTTYADKKLPKNKVNAYVPYRNLLFLSMALSLAESTECEAIYAAFNKDDGINYWDCSKKFITNINTIAIQNSSIQIMTPFLEISKKEVVQLAHKLNVNITQTISCYQPIDNTECRTCFSCISKQMALE